MCWYFVAVWQALDLLSSSHTNQHDAHQITTLIAQARSQKDKYAAMQRKIRPVAPPAKPLTPKKARKEESIRFQEETNQRHPNATSILNRPRPLGDKKRNVPVLVNARGLPFLRYKKPQPRNVSSVIRTKLGRRWNWIERRDRLKIELLFAKDEEEWDRVTETKEPSTWSEHPANAIVDVNAKIAHFDMHAKELADNMWKIVLARKGFWRKKKLARSSQSNETKWSVLLRKRRCHHKVHSPGSSGRRMCRYSSSQCLPTLQSPSIAMPLSMSLEIRIQTSVAQSIQKD
jgi:hypothetical protein